MKKSLFAIVVVALGLASVLVGANPAQACVLGSCGDSVTSMVVETPVAQRMFGHPLVMRGKVIDRSDTCLLSPVGCNNPTGSVDFHDGVGGPTIGSGTLLDHDDDGLLFIDESDTPQVIAHGLAGGSHTLEAKYVPGGDDNYNDSHGTLGITILPAPTSTDLVLSTNHIVAGQNVHLTATVVTTDTGLEAGTPGVTGMVEFLDNGDSVASANVNASGVATLDWTLFDGGGHSLKARYNTDFNYAVSTSSGHGLEVDKGTTTSTLTPAGPSSTVFGQSLALTDTVAAVSPAVGTPSGSVTFKDGATPIGSAVSLSAAGTAPLSVSTLSVGVHSLTASYAESTNFLGSVSNTVTHTVNRADTTTTLTSPTGNPTTLGQPVTLNATVAVSAPGAGTPTGSVQFKDGATNLGAPVPLTGLNASLTTSTLGGGLHSITAVYLGDTNFNTSTSTALSRTVTCDTVVTGPVGGTYNVPATGTTCITNANITGGVNVPAGAKVSIVGSTIGGNLLATNAAGTIVVCGTTVSGITINNAAGAVTVGDPYTAGCAGNTTGGNVGFASNHGGVRINGNHFGGSLNVSGTTGGATVIGGNSTGGWLQCSANVPAPTNEGHPNSPGGSRSGQCATPPNF